MAIRRKSGKSMLIILIVLTVCSIGIGTGIGLFMGGRGKSGSEHGKGAKAAKKEQVKQPETMFSLGEMTVNLADTRVMRYAKLTVAIGVAEKVDEEKMKAFEPPMKDAVISVITGKRFEDLHRNGGIDQLKVDLKKAVGERIPGITVAQIYVEGLAMQ
jgi:flagellar FliL protein